jgi:hypothetical protein
MVGRVKKSATKPIFKSEKTGLVNRSNRSVHPEIRFARFG